MSWYFEARKSYRFGSYVDVFAIKAKPKIRVFVTFPILVFAIYFYINTVYPPMKAMLLFFKIWAFILTFFLASLLDYFIRTSAFKNINETIRYYPSGMLNVSSDGSCDFYEFFNVIWNKKKKIKAKVSDYFNSGERYKKIESYVDEKVLMFYFDYYKDYKTKREIKAIYDEIIKSKSPDEIYDKVMKHGKDGLIEYYTRCLMKDFKLPITQYIFGIPYFAFWLLNVFEAIKK